MRRVKIVLMIGAVLLLIAGSAQAFPPRMHSERGTVTAIDVTAQTMTLQICCEDDVFVWRDWTRVRMNGKKIAPREIAVGTPVRVSYRREVGKRALHEVRSTKTVNHCAGCPAYSPATIKRSNPPARTA
jgi:hypothetical protein